MRQTIESRRLCSIFIQFILVFRMIWHDMFNRRCETRGQLFHAVAASTILLGIQDFIFQSFAKLDMAMCVIYLLAKSFIHVVGIGSCSPVKAIQEL